MGSSKDAVIRLLVMVAVLWACGVGWHLHQEVHMRRQQKPRTDAQYWDLVSVACLALCMLVAQILFVSLFTPVARAMIPKQPRWSEAVWGVKQMRCSAAVFKCSYYATMTIWCFAIVRSESWTPWVLGGSGSTYSCWTDGFPFQQNPPELRRFYLTAIGYHFSELAMVLLESPKPDFWEMLLHHALACSLTSYSYVLSYVRLGSLVLLLHGATDVFVYASKALVDTKCRWMLALSYMGLVVTYGYLRIFVFPVYIMRSSFVESQQEVERQQLFGWSYLNFGMCCLLSLHVYWFGLILKVGLLYGRTGQLRDLQSNLSLTELNKQKKRA